MEKKHLYYAMLVAGMSLGTAWAIRGQFGHEQGAAWAGGIGGLSIVLLAKRPDWYAKAFQLALASAMGWGIGGIISYGKVVGYGRGSDFGNVYFGFLMLMVIGGLFGLIGGGLFGLTLISSQEKPVKWPQLIVEMTSGALIFYYLLIEELGWLMTPPRSEAWAACFGMMVAMFWYLFRNDHKQVVRLAVLSGLGGAFGFAFGNFLQVMGNVMEFKFNFWNVMEYSIGFFGGMGMSYGTFTSHWPQTELVSTRKNLIFPITALTLIIPFIVWDQSFETERLLSVVAEIDPMRPADTLVRNVQWISLLCVPIFFGFFTYRYLIKEKTATLQISSRGLYQFFFASLGLYILYSLLITFAFMSLYRVEQYLYILNAMIISFLVQKFRFGFENRGTDASKWTINLLFILAFFAILTAIAISSHGELNGAQNRF